MCSGKDSGILYQIKEIQYINLSEFLGLELTVLCYIKHVRATYLTFRHRASLIEDRRFATVQITIFIYLINKYKVVQI